MKWLCVQLPLYLAWSALILAIGAFLGAGAFLVAPEVTDPVLRELIVFAESVLDRSSWEVLLFVFMNNTVKALGAMLFGVLFAVVPALFLLVNGFVLGLVLAYSVSAQGVLPVAASLLPHGIIELPAMILAGAIGLLLGVHFIQRLRHKTDVPITSPLLASGRLFVILLVPLFLLAAAIEIYITPAVVGIVVL